MRYRRNASYLRLSVIVPLFIMILLLVASSSILAGERIKLTIAHAWPAWFMEDYQKVFDRAFMDRHPNIEIDAENSSWGGFSERYLLRLASGTAPDVMYLDSSWMPRWFEEGFLLNLDPYISRDSNEFDPEDFHPALLNVYKYEGKQMAIPYGAGPIVLFYNKDLFSKAGLMTPAYEWEWEAEFLETARKLTKYDESGDTVQAAFAGMPLGWMAEWTAYAPWGGSILDESGTHSRLDTPATLRALEFWTSLYQDYRVVGGNFGAGTQAMRLSGTWEFPTWNRADINWDIAHVPSGPVRKATSMSTGSGYGVVSGTKHPEAAWIYLKEYLSSENMAFMWGQTRRDPPARRSAMEVFIEQPGDPESAHVLSEMMNDYAILLRVGGSKWWDILSVNDQFAWRALGGDISPQEALVQADRQVTQLLKEQNR